MNKRSKSGMSLIVKVITRLTVGFILLLGIYVLLHGDVSPGGGFAGGVIIALSLQTGQSILYDPRLNTYIQIYKVNDEYL